MSMCSGKWGHMCDELLKELIGIHEHGKVSSRDRYELFPWGLSCLKILPGKLRRCREIFRSLEEKYWNGKF